MADNTPIQPNHGDMTLMFVHLASWLFMIGARHHRHDACNAAHGSGGKG